MREHTRQQSEIFAIDLGQTTHSFESPPNVEDSFLSSPINELEDNDEEEIRMALEKSWRRPVQFVKAKSVFKEWVFLNKAVLKSMFENDQKLFKIEHLMETKDDVSERWIGVETKQDIL